MEKLYNSIKLTTLEPNQFDSKKNALNKEYVNQLDKTIQTYPAYKAEISYDYVKQVIRKINNENNKINITIPNNDDFKFAFINTIQKFELPEKFIINHNDVSEFARYFYPYISLVIEPRKRQSKNIKDETFSIMNFYNSDNNGFFDKGF